MPIDFDAVAASPLTMLDSQSNNPFGPDDGKKDGSFADAVAAKVEADNKEILARREANSNAEEFAYIREHGFRQYAEKLHEEKMEEMRKKILEEMGLTEEALQQMSPEQRQMIEEGIQREIEARMAANAAMNDGERADQANPAGLLKVSTDINGYQSEPMTSGPMMAGTKSSGARDLHGGAIAGMMAVLEAQEARDATTSPDTDDPTKNG